MSIRNKRRGRLAYANHLGWQSAVIDAAVQIGQNVRNEIELHGGIVRRTVIHTPTETGIGREVSESDAYAAIGREFSPFPQELPMSIALGLVFDSEATVFSKRGTYKIASRIVEPVASVSAFQGASNQ